MRSRTPKIRSALKTLNLLEGLCENAGHRTIADISKEKKIPLASLYRQVSTLEEAGLVVRIAPGKFVASHKIFQMASHVNRNRVRAAIAETVLGKLARKFGTIAQLGTLDTGMVTYLLKVGDESDAFFTVVGSQLEAYCSALGKILLAHSPSDVVSSYLKEGPFIALTENTITDPEKLREEIARVKEQGYAQDREEIELNLSCLAVPIRDYDGVVRSAISISQKLYNATGQMPIQTDVILAGLRQAAAEIEAKSGGLPTGSAHDATSQDDVASATMPC